MRRCNLNLIASLALAPVPSLAAAEQARVVPVDTEALSGMGPWIEQAVRTTGVRMIAYRDDSTPVIRFLKGRVPVMRRLRPDLEWPRERDRPVTDRPLVPEREAILPDPDNGRDLINRVLGRESSGWLVAVPTATALRALTESAPRHRPAVRRMHP